jgi:hypothetical protein
MISGNFNIIVLSLVMRDFEERSVRAKLQLQMTMGFAMGCFYILIGAFFFFAEQMGYQMPQPWSKILAVIMFLYGGFRLYRAYLSYREMTDIRKNRHRD